MKKYSLATVCVFFCAAAYAAVAAMDIFSAVNGGNVAAVRQMLGKNPRLVLEVNGKGLTPFLLAVQKKDLDMAYLLIKSSARLTARCGKGNALHIAVANQDEPMIKLILKEAAAKDPTLPERLVNHQRNLYDASSLTSDDGNTPLHVAAKRCDRRIYNYLLAYGADDSLSNKMDKTPSEIIVSCQKTQQIMAKQKKIRQAKELAAARAPRDEGI